VVLVFASGNALIAAIALVALAVLGVTGAIAGRLGGAPMSRAVARVVVGGGLAMALTALVGTLVGAAV
jgi:VIT1/CCC1 family predicted Fe2+/Mn2+ transporter